MTERKVEVAAANGNGVAPLLELHNLVKEFPITAGAILQRKVASVKAVSDVSFAVPGGRRSAWSASPGAARPRSAS